MDAFINEQFYHNHGEQLERGESVVIDPGDGRESLIVRALNPLGRVRVWSDPPMKIVSANYTSPGA